MSMLQDLLVAKTSVTHPIHLYKVINFEIIMFDYNLQLQRIDIINCHNYS